MCSLPPPTNLGGRRWPPEPLELPTTNPGRVSSRGGGDRGGSFYPNILASPPPPRGRERLKRKKKEKKREKRARRERREREGGREGGRETKELISTPTDDVIKISSRLYSNYYDT